MLARHGDGPCCAALRRTAALFARRPPRRRSPDQGTRIIFQTVPTEWSDPARVSDYLAREIPHRDLAEQLLLEALPARLGSFLDLGTGAGRLLALLRSRHPEAQAVGTDVSEPMLARARERFDADPSVALAEHDMAEPLAAIEQLGERGPLDAVVSALAVHHLEDDRKRTLFAEIRERLRPGGVFANLDLTSSPTPAVHARFRAALGRVEDDPADRLADACTQLTWLREAGFATADCRFKWMELTLLVAGKGPAE
jgi:SAM-dependent methyltransferase